MLDLIVVGAGLSGLFAGALAARHGLQTLVIAQGIGATHIGSGCIDVLGYDAKGERLAGPLEALPALVKTDPAHPYALAGQEALRAGLAELQRLCEAAGYPLVGEPAANYWLPTAVGAIRPTCLAPESFVAGEVRRPGKMVLAALPGFRDFHAAYAVGNLRRQQPKLEVEAQELRLPERPARREAYATDLARLFDEMAYRAKAAKSWKTELVGVERVGLPAVLGLRNNPAARRDLAERLGADVFEVPIPPPSVPGMRLYNALAEVFQGAGGRLVLGPRVIGEVDGSGAKPRVRGVVADSAGRWKVYQAGTVILASGGFLGGGLLAERAGVAAESVFDLPVVTQAPDQAWFRDQLLGDHPAARFGIRVDESMRPLDAEGEPMYPNLFAAGEVIGGADRLAEGSREGISIATAYKALATLFAGVEG